MLDDHAGEGEWSLPQLPAEDIIAPGLTSRHQEVHDLAQEISRRLEAFQYKQRVPSLWLVFLGGTGTGKSTLFNALCGRPLSQTGVERPKTRGPVAYAHASLPVETGFPFPEVSPERRWVPPAPDRGHPGLGLPRRTPGPPPVRRRPPGEAQRAGGRLSHRGLLGGTGKSSLTNALAGSPISSVSTVGPTPST